MSLENELEGVTKPVIESPDDHSATPDLDPTVDGGPGETNESAESAGASAPEAQGRSLENVRGELLRKLEKSEQSTRELLAENARLLGQMMQMIQTGPAATQSKKPESLDDISLSELESQRGQVPEEKRAEFDSYLIRRRIDEGIKTGITKVQEESKYADERRKANQLAVDRFPQLSNRGSELYAEVNRRLSTLDPNFRKYNPRIVLNLTEDIASELGIAPRKVSARPRITNGPSSIRSDSKPAPHTEQGSSVLGDEEFAKIAKRLGHAMKGRKFDKAKIMKNTEAYAAALKVPQE